MKKAIIYFFSIIFIVVLLTITAVAYDSNVNVEGILPSDTIDILKENGFESFDLNTLLNLSLGDVFKYIFECVKTEFTTPFTLIYVIFIIILITVIASGMNGGFLNTELQNSFSIIGVLCLCATVFTPIITCMQQAKDFISEISSFIEIFTPALSGVMIVSGQVTTGFGYQAVMIAASEILSAFLSGIIVPLLFIYLAFSVAGRATSWFNLESVTSTVKTVVTWCLTVTVSLFVSLITIKGLVGAGADSLALRTGKFLLGSFVPAVGSALSEAAATVQNSVGVIKNATGVFGIIAAALYFIPPLIKVLLYKLTCDISSAVGELLGAKQISALIRDVSTVLGLISAIILSYGVLIILSTAVSLMMGNGG